MHSARASVTVLGATVTVRENWDYCAQLTSAMGDLRLYVAPLILLLRLGSVSLWARLTSSLCLMNLWLTILVTPSFLGNEDAEALGGMRSRLLFIFWADPGLSARPLTRRRNSVTKPPADLLGGFRFWPGGSQRRGLRFIPAADL